MPDQEEYEDHGAEEYEEGEGMDEDTFTLSRIFTRKGKKNKKKHSKMVDYKAQIIDDMLHDGSWRVTKVAGEHNHALYVRLSHFMPSHREVSQSLKRHLVAHDIAGLRPSKSIRLLEV
ncbi:hypothetical protein RND71_033702 [Anisodus tanguticus]|uniref:Protein FAR1-RELATED SEQUENCE n=1 Tax=Anisodus tanguticus TaxID=243964 RepID=A0AAE1UWD8_9SOLA|nr:hypothetical protein RND71_033702 [Anisodus tanguticus]